MRCKKIQNELKQISALWLHQNKEKEEKTFLLFSPSFFIFIFIVLISIPDIVSRVHKTSIHHRRACLFVCVCVPLVLFLSNHTECDAHICLFGPGQRHQYVDGNTASNTTPMYLLHTNRDERRRQRQQIENNRNVHSLYVCVCPVHE